MTTNIKIQKNVMLTELTTDEISNVSGGERVGTVIGGVTGAIVGALGGGTSGTKVGAGAGVGAAAGDLLGDFGDWLGGSIYDWTH